jgi:hypothetical protein
MTVAPLAGPHIQATGYRVGRARAHTPNPPCWLALHTTEGIADEIRLGEFWQGRNASSNAGIGRDGGYATYVRYGDTAWTNPNVHDDTETLEICAMAGWSRSTWLSFGRMLETVAHWIAWRSEVRGIPIVRREGTDIANFRPGVVDHDGINDVFHDSTHWDVGENFPWDIVLSRAKQIRYGPQEDDMATPEENWDHVIAFNTRAGTMLSEARTNAILARGNTIELKTAVAALQTAVAAIAAKVDIDQAELDAIEAAAKAGAAEAFDATTLAAQLAALLPAVDQDDLEGALREVLGSVDEAPVV